MTNTTTSPAGKHRSFVAFVALLAVSFIFILGKALNLNPSHHPSMLIGKVAPDFSAALLQKPEEAASWSLDPAGEILRLSDLRGHPVILNFWASWCTSCKEEAKEMEAFWKKTRAKGVIVLGVAVQDEKEAALSFAAQFGKTYLLGLDVAGSIGVDYGVSGVPETFFIDAKGIVQNKFTGPMDEATLENYLSSIL